MPYPIAFMTSKHLHIPLPYQVLWLTLAALLTLAPHLAQAQYGEAEFRQQAHDLGEIPEDGGIEVARFFYKNVGNDSLTITNVEVDCGCTRPNWLKAPLAPGDSAFITTAFDPKGREGRFEKSIIVYTDGAPGVILLRLNGQVVPAAPTPEERYPIRLGNLRLQSQQIALGKVYAGESASGLLKLYHAGQRPIAILTEKINLPKFLTISYLGTDTLQPGDTTHIRLRFDAALVDDWGFVFSYFDLITDDANTPRKRIHVTANIREYFPPDADSLPRVHFNKRLHDFGEIAQKTVNTTTFTLTNIGDGLLIIRKAKASCGCTTGEPEQLLLQSGEHTDIAVTFNSGMRSGPQTKHVTIICNDPKQPETHLEIKANVISEE